MAGINHRIIRASKDAWVKSSVHTSTATGTTIEARLSFEHPIELPAGANYNLSFHRCLLPKLQIAGTDLEVRDSDGDVGSTGALHYMMNEEAAHGVPMLYTNFQPASPAVIKLPNTLMSPQTFISTLNSLTPDIYTPITRAFYPLLPVFLFSSEGGGVVKIWGLAGPYAETHWLRHYPPSSPFSFAKNVQLNYYLEDIKAFDFLSQQDNPPTVEFDGIHFYSSAVKGVAGRYHRGLLTSYYDDDITKPIYSDVKPRYILLGTARFRSSPVHVTISAHPINPTPLALTTYTIGIPTQTPKTIQDALNAAYHQFSRASTAEEKAAARKLIERARHSEDAIRRPAYLPFGHDLVVLSVSSNQREVLPAWVGEGMAHFSYSFREDGAHGLTQILNFVLRMTVDDRRVELQESPTVDILISSVIQGGVGAASLPQPSVLGGNFTSVLRTPAAPTAEPAIGGV